MQTKPSNESAIIYNVTTKVDIGLADKWLIWIKEVHIPEMMSTGCFTHTQVLRLVDVDDAEGPTYAVQYHCENETRYKQYIAQYASLMRKRTIDTWGESVLSFRSVLQVID